MKSLILLLSLSFSSFMVNAQKAKTTETVAIETRISCDHCKTCESCGGRLEKAVYGLKGVKRVDIDDQKKVIKVVFNNQKTSIDQIRETIAASGYDADGVKALPEAYDKLDDCCKQQ